MYGGQYYLSGKPLAILVPANPLAYPSGSDESDRANVDEHKKHADIYGAVYWNVQAIGRSHPWINDVKTMYFVQPREKSPYNCDEVTHKGETLWIKHFETKGDMRAEFPVEEVKYLYGTRKKVWELENNNGYNWNRWSGAGKWGFIFFKIKKLRPLKQRRRIRDFKRVLGMSHKPVERCRNYVIVFDGFFE